MGWNNPPIPWSEHEKNLRDASRPGPTGDGGDSPAWSAHRFPYQAPVSPEQEAGAIPYAELHVHSSFSFLDGVSAPEKLVEQAALLGLSGLGLSDHNGFYGAVRFAEAAAAHHMPTVFGAEVTLGTSLGRSDVPDPAGTHLLVLARQKGAPGDRGQGHDEGRARDVGRSRPG
jgi:error-prone DNA polymerase